MISDGILQPKPSPRAVGLAYGLWFVSAALSVLTYLAGRAMIIRTYVRFFPSDLGSVSLVTIVVSIAMAILPIAIIIGGFEYQHRYMGKAEGWAMLARTLAVEIGILLLALYI